MNTPIAVVIAMNPNRPITETSRAQRPRFRFAGFTLIELLLVVVLIAVTAVLALPNLGSFLGHTQLDNTAENLVATMSYAKNRAVMERRQLRLVFDGDFKNYWLVTVDPTRRDGRGAEIEERLPGRFGRVVAVPGNIAINSTVKVANFFPDGRIDKVQFDVCEKSDCQIVTTLWQRGRIEILKSEAETVGAPESKN